MSKKNKTSKKRKPLMMVVKCKTCRKVMETKYEVPKTDRKITLTFSECKECIEKRRQDILEGKRLQTEANKRRKVYIAIKE